jgi:hypothetical protein
MEEKNRNVIVTDPGMLGSVSTRRSFLRALGIGGSIVLMPSVFAACSDDDDDITGGDGGDGGDGGTTGAVVLNLSTDIGIFNYAYALEQLEAAFYTEVVSKFSTNGITDTTERAILTDIRNHEVIHRDFFKTALGTSKIKDLAVNFSSATSSRQSVLQTAQTFEDLGVAAYNGAGKYLSNKNNLLVAGKIVSVEARHASVIRDLIDTTGKLFAGDDVVDANGLDQAFEPVRVLSLADPFITTTVSIGTQPTA